MGLRILRKQKQSRMEGKNFARRNAYRERTVEFYYTNSAREGAWNIFSDEEYTEWLAAMVAALEAIYGERTVRQATLCTGVRAADGRFNAFSLCGDVTRCKVVVRPKRQIKVIGQMDKGYRARVRHGIPNGL
jgi:hypothetical protein